MLMFFFSDLYGHSQIADSVTIYISRVTADSKSEDGLSPIVEPALWTVLGGQISQLISWLVIDTLLPANRYVCSKLTS